MQRFFRDNAVFLTACLLYLLIGGILLVLFEQGDAILFFSEHRSWLGDQIFINGTKLGEAIPYFIAVVGLLFLSYRQALLIPFVGLAVTVVSYLTKSLFAADRPSVYFEKLNLLEEIQMVEGVVLHTGATSFPSGHTMSAFALFGFVAFCIPQKKYGGLLLFALAALAGISRIYLVQHFLRDIYIGAVVGLLIAFGFYLLDQFLVQRFPNSNLNQHLSIRRSKASLSS